MTPDQPSLPVPDFAKSLGTAPPTPVFGAGAKKPKQQSQVASFLSGATLPARENLGTKTLTGQ